MLLRCEDGGAGIKKSVRMRGSMCNSVTPSRLRPVDVGEALGKGGRGCVRFLVERLTSCFLEIGYFSSIVVSLCVTTSYSLSPFFSSFSSLGRSWREFIGAL